MAIILKKPVITEKAINRTNDGYYTFITDLSSTKHSIKEAIEKLFKVNVVDIKTIIRKGSSKRVGAKRRLVSKPNKKIAIVKLKKDQTISLFASSEASKNE